MNSFKQVFVSVKIAPSINKKKLVNQNKAYINYDNFQLQKYISSKHGKEKFKFDNNSLDQ